MSVLQPIFSKGKSHSYINLQLCSLIILYYCVQQLGHYHFCRKFPSFSACCICIRKNHIIIPLPTSHWALNNNTKALCQRNCCSLAKLLFHSTKTQNNWKICCPIWQGSHGSVVIHWTAGQKDERAILDLRHVSYKKLSH